MIDIHSHILPKFDDGARSIGESVEMARIAANDGTTILFATPHVVSMPDLQSIRNAAESADSLRTALIEENIELRIVTGAEVYPMYGITDAIDDEVPILLGPGGKYMLLDSPLSGLPVGFNQLIFDIQTRGISPIIAHPERVNDIQKDPLLLEELVNKGVLFQINATSITGLHGDTAKSMALQLLKSGWAHFIASDAHSPRSRRPGLSVAADELKEILGEETVLDLVENNPRRVLEGEPVPTNPGPFQADKPKRRFWLFGKH